MGHMTRAARKDIENMERREAQHRAEMCKMLSGRVIELEGENAQLKASLHDTEKTLARCEGWRAQYWEERDQARRWAALWKLAAKKWRAKSGWWEDRAWEELQRRASLEAARGIQQSKKEKQLRAALDGMLRCSAYREYGQCSQCEQRAVIALKEPTE